MSQWLYEASNEYTLTSWYIMRQYAAKIEDKEQKDIEWIYSQNHL